MSTGGSNLDYSLSETLEEEKPVNICTMDDAEEIWDTRSSKVRDIYFQEKSGFVKWTLAVTNLKPSGQTRGHVHRDYQELCIIERGEGFAVLDGVAHRVRAGTYILIPLGCHHKIINSSVSDEMIFINHFPGHIIRQGHIRQSKR